MAHETTAPGPGLWPGLSTCGVQLEARFKVMWANHGDEISRQYAGTGALKSGFTRTGKRTFGGKLDDGYKSLKRYYLNNFRDGRKQDALDLVTGTYRIEKGARAGLLRLCATARLQLGAARAWLHGCPPT